MKSIKNKITINFRRFSVVAGLCWMLIIACSDPTDENWLYRSFGVIGFYGINLMISAMLLIIGGAYDNLGSFDDEDESNR